MRFVVADLKERMMVGKEHATGFPNLSVIGARRAVPLPAIAMIPWK